MIPSFLSASPSIEIAVLRQKVNHRLLHGREHTGTSERRYLAGPKIFAGFVDGAKERWPVTQIGREDLLDHASGQLRYQTI